MTDLTERLRDGQILYDYDNNVVGKRPPRPIELAAADKIDRLQAENEELRKWIKALQAQKTRLMTSAAPLGDHTHD